MVNDDDTLEEQHLGRLRCVIEEDLSCAECESPDSNSTIESPTILRRSAKLEVLTLDFVTFGYLGAWLFSTEPSTVDISCLRELRVAHFPDPTIIERLIVSVGPALEHLHLKPGCWNGRCPPIFICSQVFPCGPRAALETLTTATYPVLTLFSRSSPVRPFNLSCNTGLRSLRLTLEEPDTALEWSTTFLACLHREEETCSSGSLERIGLEFYVDIRKLDACTAIAAAILSPWNSTTQQRHLPSHAESTSLGEKEGDGLMQPFATSLKQVEIGLFASPSNPDFVRVNKVMDVVRERGVDVRVYQLGLRSQRSNRQLTPRISRYEA